MRVNVSLLRKRGRDEEEFLWDGLQPPLDYFSAVVPHTITFTEPALKNCKLAIPKLATGAHGKGRHSHRLPKCSCCGKRNQRHCFLDGPVVGCTP